MKEAAKFGEVKHWNTLNEKERQDHVQNIKDSLKGGTNASGNEASSPSEIENE